MTDRRAMVARLDEQGYKPDHIAKVLRVPLAEVTDTLVELGLAPTPAPSPAPPRKESPAMSTSVEIEWAEPPAPSTRGPQAGEAFDAIVDELKKHPGRWAAVVRGRSSISPVKAFKDRGCEAVGRRGDDVNGKPRYDIYARWPAK